MGMGDRDVSMGQQSQGDGVWDKDLHECQIIGTRLLPENTHLAGPRVPANVLKFTASSNVSSYAGWGWYFAGKAAGAFKNAAGASPPPLPLASSLGFCGAVGHRNLDGDAERKEGGQGGKVGSVPSPFVRPRPLRPEAGGKERAAN